MTLYCMPTGCTHGHTATEYYEMDYTVIIKRCISIMKYKCYIDQPSRVIKIKLALIIRTLKSQLSVSQKHNNTYVYDIIYERAC